MIIRIRSSILDKLSASDVAVFSSWCSVVSPDTKSFHPGWRQSLQLCLFPVLVAGHEASDLHPKTDYWDKLQKQTFTLISHKSKELSRNESYYMQTSINKLGFNTFLKYLFSLKLPSFLSNTTKLRLVCLQNRSVFTNFGLMIYITIIDHRLFILLKHLLDLRLNF